MPRSPRVPAYRLHKPSGQAVVTIRDSDGERGDVYLGVYNSRESKTEYARVIAELATAAAPDQVQPSGTAAGPSKVTVAEVLAAFWLHAHHHYRRVDGTLTNEVNEYRQTFKPVRKLYGYTLVRDFGPLALKTVRDVMVKMGLSRKLVNQRVGRIRRAFKWAASEQLLPVSVYQGLATVTGLQCGRTAAPDREPVFPVATKHVRLTMLYVRPEVAAMAELQLLTGMRPGEVCGIRPADIDTSCDVWLYKTTQHKTAWRGKRRVIAIGPQGQALLKALFTRSLDTYLFSPRRAVEELHADRAAKRKTPRYPSHERRNAEKRVAAPARRAAEKYKVTVYEHAIARACDKAFPAPDPIGQREGETRKEWRVRLTDAQADGTDRVAIKPPLGTEPASPHVRD
jgi:integrase